MQIKTNVLRFVVPGEPVGKARPRVCVRCGRAHAYTPAKTANYENLIANCAKAEMIREGFERVEKPMTVKLIVMAFFCPPKSWSQKKRKAALQGVVHHIVKPDLDNVLKAVGDALNGVVYDDDSQITDCHIRKAYAETARIEVFVTVEQEGEY